MRNKVLEVTRPTYSAAIVELDSGVRLTWDDHVVNEWEEHFSTLPLALARLAALEECCRAGDGNGLFLQLPGEFEEVAQEFLNTTTSIP